MPSDGKSSLGLCPGELKYFLIFHQILMQIIDGLSMKLFCYSITKRGLKVAETHIFAMVL
jgi:hypothetical protein